MILLKSDHKNDYGNFRVDDRNEKIKIGLDTLASEKLKYAKIHCHNSITFFFTATWFSVVF